MAGIPEEIVDRVKAEANIVDVIGDYVRLRRAGKNWVGLCPFHDDRKPSLNVEPVRGIFKCFACGKGGNVFTFLMEKNGWSFPETVRSLAESLGIEIPEARSDRQEYSERERLAAAVRDAARYYFATLRSEEGARGWTYFRQRGFSDDIARKFGLGYAPDEWDGLLKHLSVAGYDGPELERAGLVIRREGGGFYDRFRGRAIFPIFSSTGRVVGFGARRMTDDPDQPKYINSPETPVYQKSRVLYGLFQAKDSIRRTGRALFVEGYADVISLHDAGVTTAVATSGTAMSREHAEIIGRYCTRIVLVFDSDRAGEAATERGIDVLLRQGLDVSVLRLPDGEDPDTFVRKFGAKEFERRIDESISFLEYRARALKLAGDFDAPDRQAAAIRSVVNSIALIPDALKRELYVQKIAADFHLSEPLLFRELERALGAKSARPRERSLPIAPPPPRNDSDALPPAPSVGDDRNLGAEAPGDHTGTQLVPLRPPIARDQLPPAEVGLLSVLVHGDPQMLEHVFERIDPEDFSHELTRELVALILGHYVNQRSFTLDDLVMEELSPELRDLVTLLAVEQESISGRWMEDDPDLPEPNPWRAARDCLIRIEQQKIERHLREVQDRLQRGEIPEEEALVQFRDLAQRSSDLSALVSG